MPLRSNKSECAIAKGISISQSAVNRLLYGQRGISLETVAKVCEYLKLQLQWGTVKSSPTEQFPSGLRYCALSNFVIRKTSDAVVG